LDYPICSSEAEFRFLGWDPISRIGIPAKNPLKEVISRYSFGSRHHFVFPGTLPGVDGDNDAVAEDPEEDIRILEVAVVDIHKLEVAADRVQGDGGVEEDELPDSSDKSWYLLEPGYKLDIHFGMQ
jgi:hypothetical protein